MAKVRITAVSIVALGSAFLIGFMPLTVPAESVYPFPYPLPRFPSPIHHPVPYPIPINPVNGTVDGGTATALVEVNNQEYRVTSTTDPIQYITFGKIITNAMADEFPAINIAFAGHGVYGRDITPIAPEDFKISQYEPWVANNNSKMNYVTLPNRITHNLKLTKVDGGGANIQIQYTPLGRNAPNDVNFLQALTIRLNLNGKVYTTEEIDTNRNVAPRTPFYNSGYIAGTGTTYQTGTSPLESSLEAPAWMVDLPYFYSPMASKENPFTITYTFQTFIEATQMIEVDGVKKPFDVLYGGVQWGFTVTSTAVPEPTTLTLLAEMVAVVSLCYFWRQRTAKGTTIAKLRR